MTTVRRARSAASRLAGFMAEYTPEVRAVGRAALARMRARVPAAVQLVYDNYNGLVIAFGPSERASDAVLSIVLYPRWVTLFFADGARLRDPTKRLRGAGKRFRHVVLEGAWTLDDSDVRALVTQALARAKAPIGRGRGRIVVKSVSPKRRPRRPR